MTEATGTTTTIYSGNYVYQNDVLQMINQPEGYLDPNGQGGYDYGYRLKVGAQRKSRLCGNHPSVAGQVLGNIRLTFVDFDHNGSIALSEITEENNYYPFGLKHQCYNFVVNSNVNAVATKFKYNGKELNDELGLDLYDYGARFYDAALGRWHVIDPLAEKWNEFSPYNYAINNPILYIDPNGEDIYMYYYTTGNKDEKDDEMFMIAAITRALDMLNSGKLGDKDIVVITGISDMGKMEESVEGIVSKYSEEFGPTREFGVWSHASIDGPIGTVETSQYALDSEQMSLEGWSKVDFNWAKDGAVAGFYGCRTGVDPEGPRASFSTELSAKDNFKDVSVLGQTASSYPSQYTNGRRPTNDMLNGNFSYPTYLVGGDRYQGYDIRFRPNYIFPVHRLRESKNGRGVPTMYQSGLVVPKKK